MLDYPDLAFYILYPLGYPFAVLQSLCESMIFHDIVSASTSSQNTRKSQLLSSHEHLRHSTPNSSQTLQIAPDLDPASFDAILESCIPI